MADQARELLEKINDFKVTDLRKELSKRNLSKYGVKKELVERLKNVG